MGWRNYGRMQLLLENVGKCVKKNVVAGAGGGGGVHIINS
jgi:hypothetical protein